MSAFTHLRFAAMQSSYSVMYRARPAHLSCCLLLAASPTWSAELDRAVTFNIAAQPVESALIAFSKQANIQVVIAPDATDGLTVPALTGTIPARKALDTLLTSTGLRYTTVGDTVSVTRLSDSAAAQPAQTSPPDDVAAPKQPAGRGSNQSSLKTEHDRQSGSLSEIVVTAQKREERLVDVPQSVSVVSADTLTKLGATQFRDFANSIPGLNFNTAGAGFTQIALRGVTTGYDTGVSVAMYIDDVPIGASTVAAGSARRAFDPGLFDISRVEVLKGPQGTMYGASALGGLIKYVTKAPDTHDTGGEFRTGVSSTADGGVGYSGAGAANLPIAGGNAALRVSGNYVHDGGFIDNIALGRKDVDRSNVYGGRIDLLMNPSDSLSIRLSGMLQDINRGGMATSDFSYSTGEPLNGSALLQRRLFSEPFSQKFRLYSGVVSYDFGFAELTSVSSYQDLWTETFYDLSADVAPGVLFRDEVSTKKFVQETRLAGNALGTVIQWTIGGFYTHEKSQFDSQVVPGPLTVSPSTYAEYAAFGDLTWHVADKLELGGGLRYANNSQLIRRLNSPLPDRDSSENVTTYLATARYHHNERSTLYLRYATGYRPGGANLVRNDPVTGLPVVAQLLFEADTLKNYEFGWKAESADQRFSWEAAIFYIDWNNIQLTAVRNNVGVRINAPDGAKIKGAEIGLSVRPIQRLKLTGGFAYQDARMNAANADVGAAAGERLPNVPRVTGNLNADFVVAENQWHPSIGATARYVSNRWANFNNGATPPQYYLPAYTTVDLRAGFSVGSVDAQLYVRNSFNRLGQIATFNWNSVYAQPAILQPRTIGITVSSRF